MAPGWAGRGSGAEGKVRAACSVVKGWISRRFPGARCSAPCARPRTWCSPAPGRLCRCGARAARGAGMRRGGSGLRSPAAPRRGCGSDFLSLRCGGDARAGPLSPCRFPHGCLWGRFPAVTAGRSAGDEKGELSVGEHPPRARYRWLEGPAPPGRAARSRRDREVLPRRARGSGASGSESPPSEIREKKKKREKTSMKYIFKCKTARSNRDPLCVWCETLSTFKTSLSPLYQIPVNLPLAFTHFHLKSLFGLNRQQSAASGLLSLSGMSIKMQISPPSPIS